MNAESQIIEALQWPTEIRLDYLKFNDSDALARTNLEILWLASPGSARACDTSGRSQKSKIFYLNYQLTRQKLLTQRRATNSQIFCYKAKLGSSIT